jgi:small basic protein
MVSVAHLFAADDTVSVPGAEPSAYVIAAPVTMFVISLLIPILTGLLTKYTLPSSVKAIMTIVLNAAAALVLTAMQADGTAVISNAALLTFIYGTTISVVSYLGLYKPVGLTSSTPDGKLAPTVGVGPAPAGT